MLLTEGRTSKEIAPMLEISPRTVEAYRAAPLDKLDARNSADWWHGSRQYALSRGQPRRPRTMRRTGVAAAENAGTPEPWKIAP